MTQPRSRFAQIGGTSLHYLEWGAPGERAVVIWHALTGRCSDHAPLASALAAQGHYVIAPDAPGCGLSSWSPAPEADYSLAGNARAVLGLLAEKNVNELDWLGSSVGGFLGISIAAASASIPVRRLILNEVGLVLDKALHEPLRAMLASPPGFDEFPGYEAHLRKFLTRGGVTEGDDFFQNIAVAWSRRRDDGQFTSHHDPRLSFQFTHSPQDFDMREAYRTVNAPTLVLRAVTKPIIFEAEAEELASTGPKARVIDRAGGHISFLNDAETQNQILHFLKAGS